MSEQSTALATSTEAQATPPAVRAAQDLAHLSFQQAMQVGKALFASGYFDKIKNPEQAFAKILAGQEYGLTPMQAIANVHIVEGKPTLDATMVRARIKSSGKYDYKILKHDDKECSMEFFEQGQSVGIESFSIEDAKRAGLLGKNNWQRHPKSMLIARCSTQGARTYCPDVFGGPIYTPEELERTPLGDMPAETQEPRNVTPAPTTMAPEPISDDGVKHIRAHAEWIATNEDEQRTLVAFVSDTRTDEVEQLTRDEGRKLYAMLLDKAKKAAAEPAAPPQRTLITAEQIAEINQLIAFGDLSEETVEAFCRTITGGETGDFRKLVEGEAVELVAKLREATSA